MNKSSILNIRIDPMLKSKLVQKAKDEGIDISKLCRPALENLVSPVRIPVVGKVDSNTGKVFIVHGDGECVPITSDEIFERE